MPTFANPNDALYFKGKHVVLAKIGKVKFDANQEIPKGRKTCTFYNPRVSFVNEKWILHYAKEVENQDYKLNDYSMGIDLGIKSLAKSSCGEIGREYHNINKTQKVKRLKKRMKRYQRSMSRKTTKSKNQVKARKKVSSIYGKVARIRHDYTHKVTREIVDALPKRIVIEDLNVSGMMKNKHLSKAIAEQNFSKFRLFLYYKAKRRGIEIVIADMFFPSSKKCSNCGSMKKDLKLKERVYVCPVCGLEIDRDLNAARNLEKYVA